MNGTNGSDNTICAAVGRKMAAGAELSEAECAHAEACGSCAKLLEPAFSRVECCAGRARTGIRAAVSGAKKAERGLGETARWLAMTGFSAAVAVLLLFFMSEISRNADVGAPLSRIAPSEAELLSYFDLPAEPEPLPAMAPAAAELFADFVPENDQDAKILAMLDAGAAESCEFDYFEYNRQKINECWGWCEENNAVININF